MTRRGRARQNSRRVTGPASDQFAPVTGRGIPVVAHGPYPVALSGFAPATDAFGCAASVRTPSATLAAWASVAADGSAMVGWYSATWTTAHAAELEAIRRTLERCPLSGSLDPCGAVLTGSAQAAEAAGKLMSGVWPLPQGFGNYPHPKLLKATRAACQHRAATVQADQRGRTDQLAQASAALAAARQLAQLTRRLATDGIPVDRPDATAMLRRLVRGGRAVTPRRLSDAYLRWAVDQRQAYAGS